MPLIIRKNPQTPQSDDMEEMCKSVDRFIQNKEMSLDSLHFWREIFSSPNKQQTLAKCLIYKYITFTYDLGHKPLQEAVRMIRNITAQPTSTSKAMSGEIAKNSKDLSRHTSMTADVSPYKRSRAPTVPGRRKSTDPKAAAMINRTSVIPQDGMHGVQTKVKRKQSDGSMHAEAFQKNSSGVKDSDCESAKNLRDLIYTVFYLINTCDMHRWDFNDLREVFLVWNKAFSWEQVASAFEENVMKKISRPPDPLVGKGKWEQAISELLQSNQVSEGSDDGVYSSLNHTQVGESIKYATLRYKIQQHSSSASEVIEAVISQLEKMYQDADVSKLLSLLHIFCETLIMAPHVPVSVLEKAYSAVQLMFILPVPVSATVKEVLDLIQIEMKSPGYFRRTIFFQEQDCLSANYPTNALSQSTATSLFVDKGDKNWATMETALDNLLKKSQAMMAPGNENMWRRIIIEHIYQSVFGDTNCDLSKLRDVLETCSDPQLNEMYTESLSVMEQSVALEHHTQAQDFVKKQLESLSSKLLNGEGKVSSAELSSINEITDSTTVSSSSKPESSLSSVIAPPRNHSYLSRTVSSTTPLVPNLTTTPEELTASDKMDQCQIILKNFDKHQLSDAIFELVRMTAKDFVMEKRRSSGVYGMAQKRYIEKQRSSFLNNGEMRDSGLIEDYSEESGKVNKEGSPKNAGNSQSKEFWDKFSEQGFAERRSHDGSLDKLLDSFHQFSNNSEKQNTELKESNQSKSEEEIRNIASSSSTSQTPLKPPTSLPIHISTPNNDSASQEKMVENDAEFPSSPIEKPTSSSRSKKAKYKFRTFGRKGIKLVKAGIRRSASTRIPTDAESAAAQSEEAESAPKNSQSYNGANLLDAPNETTSEPQNLNSASSGNSIDSFSSPRYRTTSLPVKNSIRGKKKDKSKRQTIMQLFQSTGDVRESTESFSLENTETRRHSSSPVDGDNRASFKTFSFDSLNSENSKKPYSRFKEEDISKSDVDVSQIRQKKFSIGSDKPNFGIGDESRNRMDSGIISDRGSDDLNILSPGSHRGGHWEETGVAGVKFARKHVLRRNCKTRTSFSQHLHGRAIRKKVLKLAFVGNDRTVGDMARAYYELRRRQLTRAPLLNYLDLRLYYIPVGENTFSDESPPNQIGMSQFDLEIAEMLGSMDPWYRSVVTRATSNLMRIFPTINNEESEASSEMNTSSSDCKTLPTADNILASTITSYFRYAIRTAYVPIFKATMRTSTDDVITEVFCCRAEIGHLAYKKAIAAGRFGKLGKLVDLNNDTGPPAAFTTFKYKKFGINGSFLSSKTLEETSYYRICFVPIALSGYNKEQARFPGADCLQVSLVENEKMQKHLKRVSKGASPEDDSVGRKFTVSEAKVEVVRPIQGTFTVSLDHNLIHTNIKSFEVSRCLAPELERPNSRKRRQTTHSSQVMSLPLRVFWPSSGSG